MFETSGRIPGNLSRESRAVWAAQIKMIHSVEELRVKTSKAHEQKVRAEIDKHFESPVPEDTENDEEASQPELQSSTAPSAPAEATSEIAENLPLGVELTKRARQKLKELESNFAIQSRQCGDARQIAMWERAGEHLRRLSLCRALLRQDFHNESRITLDDISAAETIIGVSQRAFLDLCNRADSALFEPDDVRRLREILVAHGGQVPLAKLVGSGISKVQAKQLARKYPEEFAISSLRSGKAGKPATVIRLVHYPESQ